MPTWDQTPAVVDVVCVIGDDLGFSVAEDTPTFLVTGATVTADVYDASNLTTALVSMTTLIGPSGTCSFSLTDTQVTTLGAGQFVYRVRTTVSGSDRTILTGKFTVRGKAYSRG